MSSILTCPVCRLGLTFGPAHLRCRCPRLDRDHGRFTRDGEPAPGSKPAGRVAIRRVSRAAIESLGVLTFTQGFVVEYLDEGDGEAFTLGAILNCHLAGIGASFRVTGDAVRRALKAHPVTGEPS